MGPAVRILRAATVALEIAHLGTDGKMHGHSLTVEAWTIEPVDLDAWKARVGAALAEIEGQLEETIGCRTFEDVGAAALEALPEAHRVVVRLPTRGHVIECERDPA
jgi:hypothetical protein